MKGRICLLLIAAFVFFSCNKLKDYFPNPHENNALPEFKKVYGGSGLDIALSVAESPEGGYVIAGFTQSNDGDVSGYHGNGDAWVVKLDKKGNREWQKTLGGSGIDIAHSIINSPDGGYVIAGSTGSTDGDANGNHGALDAWVVKMNAAGVILWQKQLGGSRDDAANTIISTSGGGYIVAGSTGSNNGDMSGNHGFEDGWVMKLDNGGNKVWVQVIGGAGNDNVTSITRDPDGRFVITGQLNEGSDEDGNFGNNNVLLVKLNNNGDIIWQKALGRSGSETAKSITTSNDGGFAIAGSFESASFDTLDVFVMKVDQYGNLKWEKTLGGTSSDYGNAITATKDGNFLMVGASDSNDGDVSGNHGGDAWLVKLDSNGTIKWQKTLGGSYGESAHAILTRADRSFVMAGVASSDDGDLIGKQVDGHGDAWVITINDQ